MKYGSFNEYFLSNTRSSEGDAYINELERIVQFGRSTEFDRELLWHIRNNPTFTIRKAWEEVENHFSYKNRTIPRSYPFNFNN